MSSNMDKTKRYIIEYIIEKLDELQDDKDCVDEYEEIEWMEQKRYMMKYFIEKIDMIKERGNLNDEEYIAKVYKLLCKYNKYDSCSIFNNLDALYKRIL